MSFMSKTVNVTTCHIPDGEPVNWEDIKMKIVSNPVPNEDSIMQEAQWGWAGGDSALQKPTLDNIMIDNDILHFRYSCMERKIPSATKQAYIDLRSKERADQTGMPILSRKEKKEIREDVTETLLEQQPPQLVSIEVIYRLDSNVLFVGSTSPNAIENIVILLMTQLGFPPMFPMFDHDRAAVLTGGKSKEFLEALHFTDYVMDELTPGQDFMTWLWHSCVDPNSHNGHFQFGDDDILVAALGSSLNMATDERKVSFSGEGASSTKGAIYALKSGFKPVKYKLALGFRDQIWKLTLDAETMSYGSIQLPEGEELDPTEHLRERLYFIELLDSFINNLYFLYLDSLHSDQDKLVEEVYKWISEADPDQYS
jgi:hypothetical protein